MSVEYVNTAKGTFKVLGKSQETISNSVTSIAVNILFPMVKSQSLDALLIGAEQEYTIVATNSTGVLATKFVFTDIIPAGLTYVDGSFTFDGVAETPQLSGNTLTYAVQTAWEVNLVHTFFFRCTRTV